MNSEQFEKAFSDFLERREYDEAEDVLFLLVRSAFYAGWQAAGGNPLPPQNIVTLLPKSGEE